MIQRPQPKSRRQGAVTVEMALIVVVFLMFLFGILEYARFIFFQNLVNNAAREGARYAVVQTPTATTAQVQTYVDAYLAGQGSALAGYSSTSSITVFQANTSTGVNNGAGWNNAGQGQAIGVTISGTYHPIVPNF